MQSQYKLAERAVLMKLSAGLPGKNRTDKGLSATVKSEHSLGAKAGRWIKQKYPDWALKPLEKLVNEARSYHDAVTLPFDTGIGILPAALIMEHSARMGDFKDKFKSLVQNHFVPKYEDMITWARAEHNGTFDITDYPPVADLLDCFYLSTETLPVPDAGHFEASMKSLLGADAESVNLRVADAMVEAQRELMRRMIEPVKAMATKLAEQFWRSKNKRPRCGVGCKNKRSNKMKGQCIFRDSLVGNIKEIAGLAPKLNIAGDPAIDAFAADIERLTRFTPDVLRKDKTTREEARAAAEATMKRLEAYRI